MRFTLDTNVLVYAFLREDDEKHRIASDIVIRAMVLDCVLTAQSLAEFLNVVRRKSPRLFAEARAQIARWSEVFPILPTDSEHVSSGAAFAEKHKLQIWDCIIWQVARSGHAALLLTEDLQDGLNIEGMRVINPFVPENHAKLLEILPEVEE